MRANFVCRARSAQELQVIGRGTSRKYVIDRVVELTPDEYEAFAANMTQRRPFIAHNKDFMGVDNDRTWHCLLINVPGRADGILVQSGGFDFARFSAYWQLPIRARVARIAV